MNLINMTIKERFDMMRKRHAFLAETVKGYTSLEEYAKDKDEWFAVIGISLTNEKDFVSLAVFLDYEEKEEYFVDITDDGKLTISPEVWMVCEDRPFSIVNIFTEEDGG